MPLAANRRSFLSWLGATAAVPVLAACGGSPAQARAWPKGLTDAQWKAKLSKNQYWILREAGTERPGTSPLNKEHRQGTFACAGCALPLFSSSTKFESGTGWPSFWAPLHNAIGEDRDVTFGMLRVEVHCRRCGGHLGHVFNDGPRPTGLRYCMNGAAMVFVPGATDGTADGWRVPVGSSPVSGA